MLPFVVLLILAAVDFNGQIIGGNQYEPGQFPYQASLRYKNQHFCSGSILNERWIVTAAHCVTDSEVTKFMTVVVGANRLNLGGDQYSVEKVISHPLYFSSINDIALIKTTRPITFTDKVKPIALADIATAYGISSDQLKKILLNILDWVECALNRILKSYVRPTNNFCANRNSGYTICQDPGGPLISGNAQVGASPCAFGTPNIFARISEYFQWIESMIKGINGV